MTQVYPPVENPDEVEELEPLFAEMPAQQVPFYDGCEKTVPLDSGYFGDWMIYAMKGASFHASEVVEAMTWFDLPAEEEAAYDAPFPSRVYMAGARVFPSLVNEVGGTTEEAWAGLTAFQRPFLALWASFAAGSDPLFDAVQPGCILLADEIERTEPEQIAVWALCQLVTFSLTQNDACAPYRALRRLPLSV